jgi:nitroreductase
MSSLIDALQWRYAVKKFDPNQKIVPELWNQIEQALVLTPSSYGLQPWKFIVVTDQALKEKLLPASNNQIQTTTCSHFVVLCTQIKLDENYIDSHASLMAERRNMDTQKKAKYVEAIKKVALWDPEKTKAWSSKQVYIALGNLMTSAAILKIDTCPMEGIQPTLIDQILDLEKTDYRTVLTCALGYRSPEDKYAMQPKVRFPLEKIIELR